MTKRIAVAALTFSLIAINYAPLAAQTASDASLVLKVTDEPTSNPAHVHHWVKARVRADATGPVMSIADYTGTSKAVQFIRPAQSLEVAEVKHKAKHDKREWKDIHHAAKDKYSISITEGGGASEDDITGTPEKTHFHVKMKFKLAGEWKVRLKGTATFTTIDGSTSRSAKAEQHFRSIDIDDDDHRERRRAIRREFRNLRNALGWMNVWWGDYKAQQKELNEKAKEIEKAIKNEHKDHATELIAEYEWIIVNQEYDAVDPLLDAITTATESIQNILALYPSAIHDREFWLLTKTYFLGVPADDPEDEFGVFPIVSRVYNEEGVTVTKLGAMQTNWAANGWGDFPTPLPAPYTLIYADLQGWQAGTGSFGVDQAEIWDGFESLHLE